MKINGSTEAVRYLNRVNEKENADGDSRREQRHEPGKENNRDQKEPEFEVTDAAVGAAVDAFKNDGLTQANGLTAQVQGRGPGLRVVLKDGSGAVVRQFTGEEFIRLREAASQDGRKQGKILDQKL